MPILLLVALPFIEVYLLYQAGLAYGFINLIFFLLVKVMIGRMIMQRAGAVAQQNPLSAAPLGLGGLFIAAPALLTSAVGVLIVLPPTRWLLSRVFKNLFKNFAGRTNFKVFNFGEFPGQNPFTQGGFNQQSFTQERDVTPQIIDVRPIKKDE